MSHESIHLSDQDLLLAADRELPARRKAAVEEHLAACDACGERMRQLASTLDEAVAPIESCGPTTSGPVARARLRMRMAELSLEPDRSAGAGIGVPALACGAVLVVALVSGWLGARPGADSSQTIDPDPAVFLRPRPDLTPGMVRQVGASDICGTVSRAPAPVPASVHRRVFASYGADVRRSAEYELDYLITPELGGVPDARNLWPQPFSRTVWNAYVKDELELHLHHQVCEGRLDLKTAQQEIASDWISAYKRHFKTDGPRRDYTTSPLTGEDGDLLRAELQELGIVAPADSAAGPALLAMLQDARQRRSPVILLPPGAPLWTR